MTMPKTDKQNLFLTRCFICPPPESMIGAITAGISAEDCFSSIYAKLQSPHICSVKNGWIKSGASYASESHPRQAVDRYGPAYQRERVG
jgi:hypothetical protein